MIVARFFQGPVDGKTLVLPYEEPLDTYVIPHFGTFLDAEYFYLLSGQLAEDTYGYLYQHSFSL